ncbi:unnamed protein product [Coffea canephora]|uniref:DH200=94 genomic scaffold, scaffold_1074 n=1 Tax=Coffea canephora TaxID=49390 RepID=A0A068VHJ6_COFCA|nr:unnamed protein product [Coffea canephora]
MFFPYCLTEGDKIFILAIDHQGVCIYFIP